MTFSLSPLEDLIPIVELEAPTQTPEVAQIHFTPEDLFRTVARHLFRQGCHRTRTGFRGRGTLPHHPGVHHASPQAGSQRHLPGADP